VKISASAVELVFEDHFWDSRDSFFIKGLSVRSSLFAQKMSVVNGFLASSSLCTLKISASAVERGFEDEFWDTRDSVFVNGLSVSSSLVAQKMSASAVELGF